MSTLHLTLISLGGPKFDDDVYEVLLPTMDGEIGVMPGHMPLVSAAKDGMIAIRRQAKDRDDDREFFAISGGVIEVSNNTLTVLVDEADNADEISEQEAKDALERAQKLKAEAKDQVSLEHAQALIDRTAVRLRVAGLRRQKRR